MPAKDFDQSEARTARLKSAEQRTFRIAGLNFTHRVAVAPEALNEFRAFDNSTQNDTDLAECLDLTMSRLLEPESAERWAEARNPEVDNPVTIRDMIDVVVWLAEVTAGRPTEPSSESSESSTSPGTPSTEGSSPEPAVVFGG